MKMTLAEWGLTIVLGGSILSIVGAYIQYTKEIKDEEEKTKQYKNLLDRSTTLLQKAEITIVKQDSLFTTQVEILEKAGVTITKQDSLLQTQREILDRSTQTIEAQARIVEQQIQTLRTLIGSEEPPVVEMEVVDIASVSVYKLVFSLRNFDQYPTRDVEVTVEDRFIDRVQGPEFINDFNSGQKEIDKIIDTYRKEEGTSKTYTTILRTQKKTFHNSLMSLSTERSTISIKVKWPFGAYEIILNLSNNNYMPDLSPSYIMKESGTLSIDRGNVVENRKYFRFVNPVDERLVENKKAWIRAVREKRQR
ncbi:hypothetical protein [Dyadobacter sp. CY326]|uniref:hypothetical protein n=1 Tax=Dyadobacter sp. CY326 TaxID=2907300 RepID=UPI001F22FD02|nr:hypothetical protein [Dyadobacter sp. CY326]MCE7063834.1 hypothetical protein [Dyadobacter sp. CY326]